MEKNGGSWWKWLLGLIVGLLVIMVVIAFVQARAKGSERGVRISEEDKQKYIQVCILLEKAVQEHTSVLEEFKKKYGLSENMAELADSVYREKHPEVVKAWEEIQEKWNAKEQEIYKKVGITDEEFLRIASALTDPANADIQKEIEQAISQAKGE